MTAFSKPVIADLIVGTLTADVVQVADPNDAANRVYIDPNLWSVDKPSILLQYRDLSGGQQAISGAFIIAGEDASLGNFLILRSPEELTQGYMALRLTPTKAYIFGSKVGQTYALEIGNAGLGPVNVSLENGDLTLDNGDLTLALGDLVLSNGGINAVDMRPIEAESETVDSITSTTYAHPTNGVGFSFVAPPSGVVRVDVWANLVLSTSAATTVGLYCGWELRTGSTVGSGTIVQAASDFYAVEQAVGGTASANIRHDGSATTPKIVTGLTPGNAYNIRTMSRRSTSTNVNLSDEQKRRLIVTPQP